MRKNKNLLISKEDILSALQNGLKIRQQDWDLDDYIYLSDNVLYNSNSTPNIQITVAELLTNKWYSIPELSTQEAIKLLLIGKTVKGVTTNKLYKIIPVGNEKSLKCKIACYSNGIWLDAGEGSIDILLKDLQAENFIEIGGK